MDTVQQCRKRQKGGGRLGMVTIVEFILDSGFIDRSGYCSLALDAVLNMQLVISSLFIRPSGRGRCRG